MIDRIELFDTADLGAVLARFDQLSQPARRLENAASQAYERFRRHFAARDWAAMAELLTAETSVDDHRRVVSAEIRRGRDVEIANMRAFAEIGATTSTATVIATRGERLVLCRTCISSEDQQPGAFHIEFLNLVEITADERIAARSAFDLDDIESAVGQLETRYLAGEAAAHAHTWSVIADIYAAFNRRELPAADWVTVDHRQGTPFASSTMLASIRAIWDLTPDLSIHIEAVHKLSDLGAVITHVQQGTSSDGFDAEWRHIQLLTVEGDRIDRCEIFDEDDVEAALARFGEVHSPLPRLENAASQVLERVFMHFAARDWIALAEIVAEDIWSEDRRRSGECRYPSRSRRRNRGHAGDRGRRGEAHHGYGGSNTR